MILVWLEKTSKFVTDQCIIETQNRPSIWDLYWNQYINRYVKEKNWKELVDIFDENF